jgi:hypothetical protein
MLTPKAFCAFAGTIEVCCKAFMKKFAGEGVSLAYTPGTDVLSACQPVIRVRKHGIQGFRVLGF